MNIISTPLGDVEGDVSEYDTAIRVFKGIPYAKPPTGDLRWKPPVPADRWDGVFKADTFGTSCYQARHTSSFVW